MLHNYKKASDYTVEKWLEKSIPDLTPYQKNKMIDNEMVRFAPFEFMESRKKVDSFWLRLSIFAIPFVWVVLFLWLPFRFLLNGRWGYNSKSIAWFDKWRNNIDL